MPERSLDYSRHTDIALVAQRLELHVRETSEKIQELRRDNESRHQENLKAIKDLRESAEETSDGQTRKIDRIFYLALTATVSIVGFLAEAIVHLLVTHGVG